MHSIINRGRGPEIAGTRLTVYDVLDYYQQGWHHTAIAATLRLSSDQVLAAIQYVEDHKEDVLAHYAQMLQRSARGNPPEIQARLEAIEAKCQALWAKCRLAKVAETDHEGTAGGH